MTTIDDIVRTEVQYRNISRVWNLGYYGQDQSVAVIDTGVNADELPDGAEHSEVDLTADKDNHDYSGHGTTMAKYILGIAPKSRIIGIKTIGKNSIATREDFVKALEYVEAVTPRPRFINMSVAFRRKFFWHPSCTVDQPCILCDRVNKLWLRGYTIVAAAGNFSSRPDSVTCPAEAHGAIRCRSLGQYEKKFLRRFVKEMWPSMYYGRDKARLIGTSQAAALYTGCLALLASAFPRIFTAGIVEVVHATGVSLSAKGSMAIPEIFQAQDPEGDVMANIYRAFVFLQQAMTKPKSMDHDKSLALTRQAAKHMLESSANESDLMFLLDAAMSLDESNYLAYYLFAVVLEHVGWKDKAEEMLKRCNELLPPDAALKNLDVYGGRRKYE